MWNKGLLKPLIGLLLGILVIPTSFAQSEIEGVRVWPAPDHTRIVFDLSKNTKYSYFSLKSPQRLVLDFKDSKNIAALKNAVANDPRIKLIRTSTHKIKSTSRIVVELKDEYKVNVFALQPAGQYGDRLVVDLYDKNKPTAPVVKAPPNNKRDIIVAIDAGHGGEDPGSIGYKGTYEKRVTLAVARRLEKLINAEKGLKAVMIRDGDYYVNLDKRTEIARNKRVDFFVSIHADAFRTPQPSGASVWVVSNRRAESELARWLDNRQRNSELLGGGGEVIKNTQDDSLALMLGDLKQNHSLSASISMATDVIAELKKITKMHKKTPQYKSLAVLKSSDIPSILVEVGFISNHNEEKNLMWSKHQQRLAQAMFNGIQSYFMEYPIAGTYYATIGYRKHKVRSGDSLSVLAQRYNTSVSSIKSANNLSGNTLRIGQTLKIPRAG
ncbi:N-acetylmuramoyl-L-alanine amidase [Thalassotalea agarivorans]|uniref:N-acetylmuramoyl-L-alanine amidase n=1 Tax=Thalassotalea agarivorans TaxID=349064 RepID=A0A1I0CII3_THASX|nr:N-acetylmuramoyl-L-alanine amidase [Thalassotalea agarivorans]SET18963.1 N-acetylmuramoyl-L-alanine amidase [Thalassotalea agarivorans]